jgi:hypothetical protein
MFIGRTIAQRNICGGEMSTGGVVGDWSLVVGFWLLAVRFFSNKAKEIVTCSRLCLMGIVWMIPFATKAHIMPNSNYVTETTFQLQNTPLPLIIAKRWNFPLRYVTDDQGYYAVRDWLNGILLTCHPKVIHFHYRQENPYTNIPIKTFTYKKVKDKTQDIHCTTQAGLITLLADARIRKPSSRLVDVRNFLARNFVEYQHLRCAITSKAIIESEFQTTLVSALQGVVQNSNILQYQKTLLGRIIDVAIFPRNPLQEIWLIECKLRSNNFYSAVGQLTCYRTELSQTTTSKIQLAIAIPLEAVDDYMRYIAGEINIHLISIVNGVVINAITGEALTADAF